MENYKVWTVYGEGTKVEYYIVNTFTKEIQSAWQTYSDAIRTCNALNIATRSFAV